MFKPRGRFRVSLRQRKKSKPRSRLPFQKMFVISTVIFLGLTLWGLWIVNRGIEPVLMDIAEAKTEDIGTKILNAAINKSLAENYDASKVIIKETNDNGDIVFAMVNAGYTNGLASRATIRAQQLLKLAEEGKLDEIILPEGIEVKKEDDAAVGIVYYIPLGMATGNALLSNLGPKVPVRLHIVGNVESSVLGKTENVGINNPSFLVKLSLSAETRVVIPFESEPKKVSTNYTLVRFTMPGETPLYYGGGSENDPAMMLPFPKNGKWQELN